MKKNKMTHVMKKNSIEKKKKKKKNNHYIKSYM